MASRTLTALARAIDRAGYTELAAAADVTIRLSSSAGVLHARWGCGLGHDGTEVTVAFTEVLQGGCPDAVVCPLPTCVRQFGRHHRDSTVVSDIVRLLDTEDLVRTAHRHAADPTRSTVANKRDKLTAQLNAATERLRRRAQHAPTPALRAACEQMLEKVHAAVEALAEIPVTGARRAQVAQRVRDELLPTRFRGALHLDDSPILAGVVGHRSAPRKVDEVLEVFTVGRNGPNLLLECPRYVADYLHRFYDAGNQTTLVLLTVSAEGLPADVVQAAARIWDPQSGGPVADLSGALHAARLCLTPA